MQKQDLLKYIDWLASILITSGLVFTILFQFTQLDSNLIVALWSYVIGFSANLSLSIARLFFSKSSIGEESTDFSLTKKGKVLLIIKSVLCLIVIVFAILILLNW